MSAADVNPRTIVLRQKPEQNTVTKTQALNSTDNLNQTALRLEDGCMLSASVAGKHPQH